MNKQSGFSLIEPILIVATVGLIALLINNLPMAASSIAGSRRLSIAREAASKKIEDLRKVDFDLLSETSNPLDFTDPTLTSLPLVSSRYEILGCPVDICPEEEAAKVVKVKVTWKEAQGEKNVELVTIISRNGLGK